ncbi:hypothetical protein DFR28_102149 [Arenicella xantha]|uniref:Uncharacterized protein n=1 Tax=Arenicella xantha TaxID=644221 RepID=A0A395JLK9_9GAMM|nr:hypothetical protein DFR28_102149 [Arenicella xantha]
MSDLNSCKSIHMQNLLRGDYKNILLLNSVIFKGDYQQQSSQWVGSEIMVRQVYSDRHYQRIPATNSLL